VEPGAAVPGERDFDRPHYKKGLTIAELWEEDRRHLSPLPYKPFLVERFERIQTNGYGKFCLDGPHWYSSAPEYAERKVTVGIRAHTVVVYREDGSPLSVHPRSFGDSRTDTIDYKTSLQALLRRPRSWVNSPFRAGLTDSLRENLDALTKLERSRILSVFSESTSAFGFYAAMESFEEAVRRGTVDAFSLQAISTRIAYDGLLCAPDQGPDLERYDRAFLDRKVSS
jgi:hypothetical protein